MEKIKVIKKETEELLKKMIEKFEVEVVEEENIFHVVVKTEEAATVIGRYGETIRALQKILEVILYKRFKEPINILININDYREKQKEKLENLAKEYALKIQESRQPAYISNLSSYERKLVHEYITKNYPDLTSYSTGEGKTRQLVIAPKDPSDKNLS